MLYGKQLTILRILALSKLKAFAGDNFNLNVAKMMQFFFDRTGNIVRKKQNAGYPQCFQETSIPGLLEDNTVQ